MEPISLQASGIFIGIAITVATEILIFVVWKSFNIFETCVKSTRNLQGPDMRALTATDIGTNPDNARSVDHSVEPRSLVELEQEERASNNCCNHDLSGNRWPMIQESEGRPTCSCGVDNLSVIQEEPRTLRKNENIPPSSEQTVDTSTQPARQNSSSSDRYRSRMSPSSEHIVMPYTRNIPKRNSSNQNILSNLIHKIKRKSEASVCSSTGSDGVCRSRPCSCWTATSMEKIHYENNENGELTVVVKMLVPQSCCNFPALQLLSPIASGKRPSSLFPPTPPPQSPRKRASSGGDCSSKGGDYLTEGGANFIEGGACSAQDSFIEMWKI